MISIEKHLTVTSRLSEADLSNPEFGKQLSDHMFIADFEINKWSNYRILPYGKLEYFPSMLALHYGQSVFEGMKAFRMTDGRISIFRPHTHLRRFNQSLERMCMPEVSEELFIESLSELIQLDEGWIPNTPGSALYLRPFCFASEPRLRIRIAEQYQFIILTSPAGKYFGKPYRLKVETNYTRTAEGGTGYAKCSGNYGSSYYPVKVANQEGFDQVLWTDAKEHKYIDEAGMMNIMFIIDGKLITPSLNSAILAGVTRDSVLQLAKDFGVPTEERRITVAELEDYLEQQRVTEAFGTGTAAVVAPVAVIGIGKTEYNIPQPGIQSFQQRAAERLHNIRTGKAEDTHHWNFVLN